MARTSNGGHQYVSASSESKRDKQRHHLGENSEDPRIAQVFAQRHVFAIVASSSEEAKL
jgi:hypothetical protein